MKIIVLSYSSNVGKSFISELLLKTRIKNCHVIAISDINSELKNYSFVEFFSEIDKGTLYDNIVIDLSSICIDQFKEKINQDCVDYFIVPVTPDAKHQHDAINTLLMLDDVSANRNKIKFIFNFAEDINNVEAEFELFLRNPIVKDFNISNIAVIPKMGNFSQNNYLDLAFKKLGMAEEIDDVQPETTLALEKQQEDEKQYEVQQDAGLEALNEFKNALSELFCKIDNRIDEAGRNCIDMINALPDAFEDKVLQRLQFLINSADEIEKDNLQEKLKISEDLSQTSSRMMDDLNKVANDFGAKLANIKTPSLINPSKIILFSLIGVILNVSVISGISYYFIKRRFNEELIYYSVTFKQMDSLARDYFQYLPANKKQEAMLGLKVINGEYSK